MTDRGVVIAASLALVGTGLAIPAGLSAQDPLIAARSDLFLNVTVIDGRGGAPRPESAVLVWGGRVRAIGSASQMQIPEGTSVVDLEGSWMVPGYIDAHATPGSAQDLQALLAAGVTGVRVGSMSLADFEARGRGSFDAEPLPRLYVGGPVLDAGNSATGVRLDSEEAALAEVASQVDEGAEFLSLSPNVPADWIVGVARAARRLDTPLWVDRHGEGWLLALRAGVDVASRLVSGDPELLPEADRQAYRSTVHATGAAWLEQVDPEGPEVDRAVTALLSRDAAVVPLLASSSAPLECEAGSPACGSVSEVERAALQAAWPKAEALVRALHGQGVRLLVGSDGPEHADWGDGFHREMRRLVDAGLSELEVISMATRNAASALGQLHERGTIEPGKRADFLVLSGDPTVDIRNARRIELVVIGGRPWRVDRDGIWERVRGG